MTDAMGPSSGRKQTLLQEREASGFSLDKESEDGVLKRVT